MEPWNVTIFAQFVCGFLIQFAGLHPKRVYSIHIFRFFLSPMQMPKLSRISPQGCDHLSNMTNFGLTRVLFSYEFDLRFGCCGRGI